MRFIVRLGLRLARRDAKRIFVRKHDFAQLRQRCRTFNGCEPQPFVDQVGVPKTSLGAPSSVCVSNCPEQITIEAIVTAMMCNIIFDGFVRQVHEPTNRRFDHMARPKCGKRLGPPRASLQIFNGAILSETPAEALYVAYQSVVIS